MTPLERKATTACWHDDGWIEESLTQTDSLVVVVVSDDDDDDDTELGHGRFDDGGYQSDGEWRGQRNEEPGRRCAWVGQRNQPLHPTPKPDPFADMNMGVMEMQMEKDPSPDGRMDDEGEEGLAPPPA
eukprot:Selendium_serpulae@DN9131_c0_g1_i1.p1